ncbi:hypothetical protein BX666DRAFT_1977682 [Dichotomocladium elegans]|nr:hypothetical protein BX666DRAFT_1977682 [Dichotomocladium elegans]
MHLVRSDARTICNADNDTLVRPSAAPQNQRAVQLPSGSAVCDEDEVVPSPSQATQEPIGLSDLEHYLHDLPWHTLSSSVEDDETQSKKKTATINCTKELFDIVLGPRGHRLRLIQRRSRVQITPDPSKPCFKLYGHPPNIEKVKNFVDILLARLRVVGNSYVIVRLGGPSVRSKLEALSSKFAGLANTVQEHDIHFTVTKFTSSITLNEMHAARNVIQAIIPDIQALATPVVLDELAYKKEYSRCMEMVFDSILYVDAHNGVLVMLGVQPRPGSPFHQIYELIHEALNDAHIPHSHESTLHVTVLKRKNRIDEAEKERRDKLLLSLDPVDILGPVVPVSIIISQERESYCYGSDYHISWATIPI